MKYIMMALSIATLMSSCARRQTALPTELDIIEAVFRHQITAYSKNQRSKDYVVFLQIAGKDPSDAFMNRFKGRQPPVKKLSQCSTENMEVKDKENGSIGFLLSVTKVTILDGGSARTEGGYYLNGMAAAGTGHLLQKKGTRWIVIKEGLMGGISKITEQGVAPNRSLAPTLNSTSSVRGSEDS